MEQSVKRPRPAPLQIGGLTVDPPLILAPMAGVTDEAYRRLMAEHGAGLVTTEMVSVEGLRRHQPATWRLCAQETALSVPLAVQLFGKDPRAMAEAARLVEANGASLVDINAGCPVKKVVKQGAGAGLLKEPDRLVRMVEEVKKSVNIPVTVKIRLGWDSRSLRVVEVAQQLSSAGVDAITVHGRTAVQQYSGQADWGWIGKVKEAVHIPVIGNGDISSPSLANRILHETNCDAVMVGRASMGNPWIFGAIASSWGSRALQKEPDWTDFYEAVCTHTEGSVMRKSKPSGHLRKLLIWYSRGCPGASRLRARLFELNEPGSMLGEFRDWVSEQVSRGIPFLTTKVPEAGEQL